MTYRVITLDGCSYALPALQEEPPTSTRARVLALVAGILAGLVLAGLALLTATPAQAAPLQPGKRWASPIVYVIDETPRAGRWPVREAAERWDNGSRLDLRVRSSCPKGAQCVRVTAGSVPGPAVGVTPNSWDGRTLRMISASVKLETAYGRSTTRAGRLALVCHEIGHAIGLSHTSSTRSCLASGVGPGNPRPLPADIARLRALYGR